MMIRDPGQNPMINLQFKRSTFNDMSIEKINLNKQAYIVSFLR